GVAASSARSRYAASWYVSRCIVVLPRTIGRTECGAAAADPHPHRPLGDTQQRRDLGIRKTRDQVHEQWCALIGWNAPQRLFDPRRLDRAAVGGWAAGLVGGQER